MTMNPTALNNPMPFIRKSILWPCILIFGAFVYSSYGIFINLSRVNGVVEYQSSSVWLSVEVFKLLSAFVMVVPERSPKALQMSSSKDVLLFAVPALSYCVNNNLSVFMQDEMDPATFQVLCNLKIASTAILYRLIIKKKLRMLQWVSLGILMFAGVINSYSGLKGKQKSLQDIYITVSGVAMVAVYCTISGFAGVYTEYILKKNAKVSLALQNCYMYSFGVILNCMLMLYQKGKSPVFHGFTRYTWAAVFSQTLNGLLMSFIMKYGSNITRLFIISSAVPIATVLSMLLFQLNPDFHFFLVVIMVVIALFMYNYFPGKALPLAEKRIV